MRCAQRIPLLTAHRRLARAASTSIPPGVKISPLQRIFVGAGAALAGFMDPSRGDMVALLGELTGEDALRRIRTKMLSNPDGASILKEKPRIRLEHVNLEQLRLLPSDSFGRLYVNYLDAYSFSPEERSVVRAVSDPELAYVMQRYREVHDFWHVLSDLPPSVLGETAVKWLEMVQTGLPMTCLSALVAPARMSAKERELLRSCHIPWAVRVGQNCVHLMSVRYEDHFAKPIHQLRELLRFEPAPKLV